MNIAEPVKLGGASLGELVMRIEGGWVVAYYIFQERGIHMELGRVHFCALLVPAREKQALDLFHQIIGDMTEEACGARPRIDTTAITALAADLRAVH